MKYTRRNFIQTSGAFAVSAAFLGSGGHLFGQTTTPVVLFSIPPAATSDPLSYLTSEHFIPFVNEILSAESGGTGHRSFKLLSVDELRTRANDKAGYTGESFSLLFEADGNERIDGQIFRFNHSVLGKFKLFVSPVGKSGRHYEAIVNRIQR